MNINWNDMRFFLALSRTQSFVAAGIELKVTHSTVSRRLSALEDSLQTQLFTRTEKGCRLTPAGEKLLPYAERMETTIVEIEEEVSGRNTQLAGSIRIGAPDGFGNCFLAPRLGRFQRLHPSLEVELIAVPMYYSLAKREIDISITIRKPTSGNIIVKKLTQYRFGLFATQKYLSNSPPLQSRDDMRNHQTIGYIEDLLYDEELDYSGEFYPGIRNQFRSSTLVGQTHAILGDNGIGIIPYFMAHSQPTLVPVLPELFIERTFWIQFNPDAKQIARVRVTIDFIVQEIESNRALFTMPPTSSPKHF
ncbi:MAG: LysR family transcriptional regulator [Desulfopila sp.]|jgi:DNA-binding transcriptional LysR family regulator|nr:LysR family transcriptional regulator [Desulfopila sp.]